MTRFKITDEGRTYKQRAIVSSGAVATIDIGVPTFITTVGAVVPGTDGLGTTSDRFAGLAATVSTDTVAAAGEVFVYAPLPGIIYTGSPKSATAANTAAKIAALKGKRVVLDLTTGTWTVDSAAADSASNAICLTGEGDANVGVLDFVVMATGSYLGQ